METLLMTQIVNLSGIHPPRNLPDHSILIGTFDTSIFNLISNSSKQEQFNTFDEFEIPKRPPKKDLNKINNLFFMSDEIKLQVQNTILKLETSVQNQSELDQLWSGVKSLLISELDSLPNLPTSNNKKQS